MKTASLLVLALALTGAALWWSAGRGGAAEGGASSGTPAATPSEIAAELGARRAARGTHPEPADPASEAHADAIALRRRAVALNDEALVALEAGELERVVELLEACLAIDPEEAVFRRNLAEVLARIAQREYERADEGSVARAILRLERAVELAPERKPLVELLARWRRVAETEDGFWVESSEHFELAYDGSRDELLWSSFELLEILEAAYHEFGERFGRYPVERGRPRIRVVLYRKAEFDGVTGIGHWAGGVFDGTVRVPVEDLGREKPVLTAVLRHEVVHAFVREVGGALVPAWLDEGLAQLLEADAPPGREARLAAARARLASGELFPLERLREGIARWTDPDRIRRAYDQSLCFVAWLEREYGERVAYEMVTGCGAGKPPRETFPMRTGIALDVALETLRDDLR